MNQHYDAIVVGGGHNGLVAAAYLARAGMRPLVLEARHTVGGAATTENPWGPDYKMTTLSYVMSLMPREIIDDLQLRRHGYTIVPMGPSYLPLPDGKRSLTLSGDPAHDHEQLSRFSAKDAAAYPKYQEWLKSIADKLHPLLLQQPPKVGSRRPSDLLEQARLAWGMRDLDVRGSADVTRLFTMSIADLLDEWFEYAGGQGSAVRQRHHRHLGRSVRAGHRVRDDAPQHRRRRRAPTNASMGSWGFPEGGMGAVSPAIADSARSFGAEIAVDAPVASDPGAQRPRLRGRHSRIGRGVPRRRR